MPNIAALIDRMPSGLLLFGDDGAILDANATLLQWLNVSRETLLTQRIEVVFPPGGKIFYHTHLFPLLRAEGRVTEIYFALQTSNGEQLPVLISGIRDTSAGSAVNLATFVAINNRQQFEGALLDAWKLEQAARDESERKSAELDRLNVELQRRNAELLATDEALKTSNASKDEYIGLVSHELKNPLVVLSGTMAALAGTVADLPPEESHKLLQELHEEFSRLIGVVDNLLVLARSELGGIDMEPVLVQHLVRAQVASEMAHFPSPELRLTIAPGLPPVVAAAAFIEQIVGNFISNARKYGRPGGVIEISVEGTTGLVNVSVANEGEPLSDAEIERFFEPFYRADAHRRETPGVGLGLTVCQRLAAAQGASIYGHARPGGGLVITLSLPIAEEPSPAH